MGVAAGEVVVEVVVVLVEELLLVVVEDEDRGVPGLHCDPVIRRKKQRSVSQSAAGRHKPTHNRDCCTSNNSLTDSTCRQCIRFHHTGRMRSEPPCIRTESAMRSKTSKLWPKLLLSSPPACIASLLPSPLG